MGRTCEEIVGVGAQETSQSASLMSSLRLLVLCGGVLIQRPTSPAHDRTTMLRMELHHPGNEPGGHRPGCDGSPTTDWDYPEFRRTEQPGNLSVGCLKHRSLA